ncbi:MAG TPA: NUDIX domain-containing protein [Gemmataceae bacterium]|nr:NUDIX domain-containing protein [Gemmataceae bacterium]
MTQRRTYEWPRPAVTVDIAVFTVAGTLQGLRLQVLLIQRNQGPFRGHWALPGGFVHENEDLLDAAKRELAEETGLRDVYLEQVQTVGMPGRDPRGHVVTVVHVALVAADRHQLAATGDARAARWFDVSALPPLAFDHGQLLQLTLKHLRRRLGETPACFELLPAQFTLSELQSLCETILDRPLDRRNFRRKVQELKILAPVRGTRREGAHRPARLYRFVPQAFRGYASRRQALPF